MKCVRFEECKSGQTPGCCYTEKTTRDKTTTELLSSQNVKELKNKAWDMTRNSGEEGWSGEGRDFFIDLVLTINLNLKMLLLSEESEMDLFNKYLLTSYYVPRTIVDSLCIATKETKNPVLMEHIFSGWGIAQECIHTLSCCSELTLDTYVSCLASTKHTLWDLWFYATIKASLPLLMRPCSVLQ